MNPEQQQIGPEVIAALVAPYEQQIRSLAIERVNLLGRIADLEAELDRRSSADAEN